MASDDELEKLMKRARDLGDQPCNDALRRAMAVALRHGRPVDPDSFVAQLLPGAVLAYTAQISMDVLTDALKTELRRILQPH
jgi:hypothetical protein